MTAVEHELTPGDPASVAEGRRLVTQALNEPFAGTHLPADMVDDAVLAVSELVTNAVAAARLRICLTVEVVDGRARVSVFDDGPGRPAVRPSTPDLAHGRGLSIVEILAARWGVAPEPTGKWVWAEFPVAVRAS